MSRRTVLVGPEAPRWDGRLALRPKPLESGVRSFCSCCGRGGGTFDHMRTLQFHDWPDRGRKKHQGCYLHRFVSGTVEDRRVEYHVQNSQ